MSWRLAPRSYERPGRPGARWWVSATAMVALALAAAYLLDPENGRARRLRLTGRARSLAPWKLAGRGAADTSGGWPEEPPPDVDSEA